MVKQHKKKQVESSDDESVPELVQVEDSEDDDEARPYEEDDSDMEIAAQGVNEEDDDEEDGEGDMQKRIQKEFAQRSINNVDAINKKIKEIKANFYNTLNSKKLIKKQGRIPFTEHMTLTNENMVTIPEGLSIHDDIKREMAFYNVTRENVKKGMEFLVQGKVPISRPDDFFAEMLKTDSHMAKVKSRLLQQQNKIQTFEERKSRMENKKFHKAIKAYKQTEKHKEKRQNFEKITQLKKQIKERGDDLEGKDFDKIFNGGENKQHQGGKRHGQKQKTIDIVKNQQKHQKRSQKKGNGIQKSNKHNNKRPGKNQRSHHKRRNKK